mmetsp:Transcript_69358/g.185000  ORF Transcript_69358/g.185000 Transcript_69358/m.185000 type:complete len:259 (+) Transcript_69358:1671-2447(+)
MPSWPASLRPQQLSTPVVVRSAHVWELEAARPMETTPRLSGCGVVRGVVKDPTPSWPYSLLPQQYMAPPLSSAHVCPLPAASATHTPGSFTACGRKADVVLPTPSWPSALDPQHETLPPLSSAHVCRLPPTSVAAVPVPSGTACGEPVLETTLLSTPSCPTSLRPQHDTAPPLSTAHMWFSPAVMAVAEAPDPSCTSCGVLYDVGAPPPAVGIPSWPYSLSPQHEMAPLSSSAHVCPAPAAIDTHTAPDPSVTACGVG